MEGCSMRRVARGRVRLGDAVSNVDSKMGFQGSGICRWRRERDVRWGRKFAVSRKGVGSGRFSSSWRRVRSRWRDLMCEGRGGEVRWRSAWCILDQVEPEREGSHCVARTMERRRRGRRRVLKWWFTRERFLRGGHDGLTVWSCARQSAMSRSSSLLRVESEGGVGDIGGFIDRM